MTKQDEIDEFTEFVGRQPTGSYLYMILHGDVHRMVCEAIRNDFGQIDIAGLWKEKHDTEAAIKQLRIDHAELIRKHTAEVAKLERDSRYLRCVLDKMDVLAEEAYRDGSDRRKKLKEMA